MAPIPQITLVSSAGNARIVFNAKILSYAILAFTASVCKASGMDTIQTPLHAALVKVLIAQRIRAGLRQHEVAARIGKPQSAIARIERGRVTGKM